MAALKEGLKYPVGWGRAMKQLGFAPPKWYTES